MGKGPLSRVIIPVAGMIQEGIAHHKQSKAEAEQARQQSGDADAHSLSPSRNLEPHESSSRSLEEHHSKESEKSQVSSDDASSDDELDYKDADEHAWALDDAQHDLNLVKETSESSEKQAGAEQLLANFSAKHPAHSHAPHAGKLPCPVILPQRRPGIKSRGFVRAYAPVLDGCGIGQNEFLEFIQGFDKVVKYSGAFEAVNAAYGLGITVASFTAGVPAAEIVGGLAFHITVEAARITYIRYETNKYLDGMNERLFQPHGLYAMFMTYKPDSNEPIQIVKNQRANADAASASSGSHHSGPPPTYSEFPTEEQGQSTAAMNEAILKRYGGVGKKLATASGQTNELDMPEAAPLIFPAVRDLPAAEQEGAFKRAFAFLGEYHDQGEREKWMTKNPHSRLYAPVPAAKPAGQFSDPNSAVNRHGIFALVTGKPAEDPTKKERKAEKRMRKANNRARKDERRMEKGKEPKWPKDKKKKNGGLLKRMKPDVVYLMIVNLPPPEELAAAREAMQEQQRDYQSHSS